MPGPEESRTPYPLLAKQTLYQMSYRPELIYSAQVKARNPWLRINHLKWWALMDSNHRPPPYQDDALTN